jgi:hypothetical protein
MDNPIIKSRFLPYEADFALLKMWRRIGNILLAIVSILSISRPFVSSNFTSNILLNNIIEYTSYIAIISYYVANIATEVFLYPASARLRRIDFIDNSLGTKFLSKESKNYFTNDVLKPGLYKLNVNCFENCYFTYNIAKEMTPSVVTKNVIFSTVFFTIAYIGLRGNILALPILQILLSTLFLTELIHHLTFVSRLNILLEKFEIHFNNTINSKSKRNDPKHPILLLLEYETTLAFNKAPLSDKVYRNLNLKLSAEWEEVKKHYEID